MFKRKDYSELGNVLGLAPDSKVWDYWYKVYDFKHMFQMTLKYDNRTKHLTIYKIKSEICQVTQLISRDKQIFYLITELHFLPKDQ